MINVNRSDILKLAHKRYHVRAYCEFQISKQISVLNWLRHIEFLWEFRWKLFKNSIVMCNFNQKSWIFQQLYGFQRISVNSSLLVSLTLIGMRQGGFTPLIIFGLDFVSWIFIKNFQTVLEVKIEINWDNLKPCQAHWVL